MKNMGKNMQPKTGIYKFREWRGLKDSAYDYAMWLKLWGKLLKWALGHPVQNVKAIFRYRWMFTYLTVPSFFDRSCEGFRGAALRGGRNNFLTLTDSVVENLDTILSADMNLHPGSKKAEELNKKIICMDELVPALVTAGFPEAKTVLYQMIPVYLPSLINQHSTTHYISQSELHGLPADVCPLPSFEAGVAIEDDYPKIGCCMITCNMPCDGSIMTTAVQDRRHGLPTHPLNVPLRWLQDEVQEYAVEEILETIRFIEEKTGMKCDWDKLRAACENWNGEQLCKFEKWEYNRTKYPPHTGSSTWMYRIFEHQAVSMSPKALANDKKVNKILAREVASGKCKKDIRYRAVIWNTPANNYANFNNWALNAWGVESVIEMIDVHGTALIDTSTNDSMMAGLANMVQTATMRAHTKGGYEVMIDDMWRCFDEFHCDFVILFDQISCKGVGAINGLFEESARKRGVKLCKVRQDLMEPTSISRRDMRTDVNTFMSTVMNAEPVDPTLIEFDDDESW